MRRWLASLWKPGAKSPGTILDADTAATVVQHVVGCPVCVYPEHGYGHEPLTMTQRRGGPPTEAIVGEVLAAWRTTEGVLGLLELLDGSAQRPTQLSLSYEHKRWPRPDGQRVELVTRIYSLDLVRHARQADGLRREADAALCWYVTGEVAPRGRLLERRALGLPLPATRPTPWRTPAHGRSPERLAEILRDEDVIPFTLTPEGDR
jgi:hypothetical protein